MAENLTGIARHAKWNLIYTIMILKEACCIQKDVVVVQIFEWNVSEEFNTSSRGKKAPPPRLVEVPIFFLADLGQIFYCSRKYVYLNCLFMKQFNFLKKYKNRFKNGVLPKKVFFFTNFLEKYAWPFCLFWSILTELFISPENMYLKKCKNRFKNGILLKTVPIKMCLTLFFLQILADFFIPPRKMFFLEHL